MAHWGWYPSSHLKCYGETGSPSFLKNYGGTGPPSFQLRQGYAGQARLRLGNLEKTKNVS